MLCAALLLNHLCGPSARNRRNRRLYSSGQSRDQAALTFDQARKMVLWNADLRQIISIKESSKVRRYDELGIEYRPFPPRLTRSKAASYFPAQNSVFVVGSIAPRKAKPAGGRRA